MALLSVNPLAKGLFRKAIISSGSYHDYQSMPIGLAQSENVMRSLKASSLEQLRALDWRDFVLVSHIPTGAPSIDGKMFKEPPTLLWKRGQLNYDSAMVGMLSIDSLAGWPYLSTVKPDSPPSTAWEIINKLLYMNLTSFGITQEMIFNEQYKPSMFNGRMDTTTSVIVRDQIFACPIQNMLQDSQHAGRRMWAYFMGSTWKGGVFNATGGAANLPAGYLPHAGELGYMWGPPRCAADGTVVAPDGGAVKGWREDYDLREFSRATTSAAYETTLQNYLG